MGRVATLSALALKVFRMAVGSLARLGPRPQR